MEFEYAVNEYTDFEYNPLEDDAADSHENHDSDSDFDDDLELSKAKTDTSAMEFRNGKDMQGIPWERLIHTREEYRKSRIQLYKNYENLSRPRHDLVKKCKEVEGGHSYFDFQFNTRLVKSTIVHFQVEKMTQP